MKKFTVLVCSLFLLFGFAGCSKNNEPGDYNTDQSVDVTDESKILLAYFSRAGENYNVGYIEKGNTEYIADYISEYLDVDYTYKIERTTPYPDSYEECKTIATQEQRDNARPAIIGNVEDMDSYDIIFLGYPIWYSTMPMCVFTFLESYDFSGKTIIPFSTHEGSGWGSSKTDLRKELPNSKILDGYSCRGASAKNNKQDVTTWLDSLGLK